MTSTAPPRAARPRRRRETRAAVRFAERASKVLISVGGIGTILAVSGILVFLVWVVAPLFRSVSTEPVSSLPSERGPALDDRAIAAHRPRITVDEHRLLGWTFDAEGTLSLWRVDTGEVLESRRLFPSGSVTAYAFPVEEGDAAFGFSDGTVRLCLLSFRTKLLDPADEPDLEAELRSQPKTHRGTVVYERVPGGIRSVALEETIGEPMETGLPGAIRLVDVSASASTRVLCAMDADGSLAKLELSRTENLLTGEVEWDSTRVALSEIAIDPERLPDHLLLDSGGNLLYLAWRDGHAVRCDVRRGSQARIVEELDLVEDDGELTALEFLIGKTTLLSGDSRGRFLAWFPTKPPDARASDGIEVALAHRLCEGGPAITSIASSARSRVAAAGDAFGGVNLWHVTSGNLLVEIETGRSRISTRSSPSPAPPDSRGGRPVLALALAPRDDAIFASTSDSLEEHALDLRHPEASFRALFTRVWYEGYPGPEHAWQSSSGTDDFEPKLGLVPLVFGTVKATAYSLVFAVPLALLAAIFTSQFLTPRLRTPIKSAVEMMASLPSVVLGFLAAVVVAPFVEHLVPGILTAFFAVPFALMLGARIWQLLPSRLSLRWSGGPRIAAMAAALASGVLLALAAGPLVERVLFAGNLRRWLDHSQGSALGGWVVLLLPAAAVAVALFSSRVVEPRVRRLTASWNRARAARLDLVRFLLSSAAAVALAFLGGWVLQGLWLDPRGGVFDTYVQRNALIVGFVMGFAVVPIIYTIAEDALSSVPGHLRLASLGAGATPWQTAVRIVVPTAASGLFSAVMVGLGRAVGETMIVLMATGNTPVLSWNLFDGFRTLSANIAVELPEAVRDSTHYRTLFLAALCLFAMTFVVNTVAEIVRQRFRRRAFEL